MTPFNSRNMLTLDIPEHLWMSSNERRHWAVTMKRTKELRERAGYQARLQLAVTAGPVLVTAFIQYPRNGRADPSNASPTVKPILDGITDAGIWADDDSETVIGPDFRREASATGVKGLHRVRLVLTPQEVPF